MTKYRINRALAMTGVASRRKAEELILSGRVRLNGQVVTELATEVDPASDRLELGGRLLSLGNPHSYYLYYKPRGIISTLRDTSGRPCIGEVCKGLDGNPRPVGRLDRKSEGLLLLTSDGEMANRLAHPSYGTQKEYQVTISPVIADNHAEQMTREVPLRDGSAKFVGIQFLGREGTKCRLGITVDEGRNKLIRRMFGYFHYDVHRLKRIRQGPLLIGKMKPGEIVRLSDREVSGLKKFLKMKP